MINEEKKYEKLVDDLKNLPKVNAPQNFESNLWRKINSSEDFRKESFWNKIISPSKLIPAGVVIASAVIIFLLIDIKPNQPEDPLNIQPRIREDIVAVEKFEIKTAEPLKKSRKRKEEKRTLDEDKSQGKIEPGNTDNEIMLSKGGEGFRDEVTAKNSEEESLKTSQNNPSAGVVLPTAEAASAHELKKDNLNFMQINLTAKEKQEVERLKQRAQASEKAKSE
jgi:hypothetical protein